jgi:hypothetical protein
VAWLTEISEQKENQTAVFVFEFVEPPEINTMKTAKQRRKNHYSKLNQDYFDLSTFKDNDADNGYHDPYRHNNNDTTIQNEYNNDILKLSKLEENDISIPLGREPENYFKIKNHYYNYSSEEEEDQDEEETENDDEPSKGIPESADFFPIPESADFFPPESTEPTDFFHKHIYLEPPPPSASIILENKINNQKQNKNFSKSSPFYTNNSSNILKILYHKKLACLELKCNFVLLSLFF